MNIFQAYQSCLVVAAHPDDEVLGAGGTIAKLAQFGVEVSVIFLTGGKTGRVSLQKDAAHHLEAEQKQLAQEASNACAILNVHKHYFLSFPDNRMDTISKMDVSHAIKEIAAVAKPDLALIHHHGDYNWDHSVAHDACMMAFRANPGDSFPQTILSFEVPSSTERNVQTPETVFCPNLYVDITSTIDTKVKALESYQSELKNFPHPRSIKGIQALAQKRGSEIGTEMAEAFSLVRHIEG